MNLRTRNYLIKILVNQYHISGGYFCDLIRIEPLSIKPTNEQTKSKSDIICLTPLTARIAQRN